MKIVADENIIYAKEAFSQFGDVRLLPGRKITNAELKDADVLIVRSVTTVGENLLSGTNVKFVGTATIGEDHIDKEYLGRNGIGYSNAKGSNALAVAEYVLSAIAGFLNESGSSLRGKSIGIIGVGTIGSKVAKFAEALGLEIIRNDPPLKRLTGRTEYLSLEEALSADIVTFHVPLNMGGRDNTFHLLDVENLEKLKPNSLLINSSRGAVVNNKVLSEFLNAGNNIFTVLDVWENEPEINLELLNAVNFATPHVAGYTYEGKVNGTVMIYNAVCNYFGLEKKWKPPVNKLTDNEIVVDKSLSLEESLNSVFQKVYSIKEDSKRTKAKILSDKENHALAFEKLRKEYPLRRELRNYILKGSPPEEIRRIFLLSKTLSF